MKQIYNKHVSWEDGLTFYHDFFKWLHVYGRRAVLKKVSSFNEQRVWYMYILNTCMIYIYVTFLEGKKIYVTLRFVFRWYFFIHGSYNLN